MAQSQLQQWRRLYAQKKQELLERDCADALEVESFDDLCTSLRVMASDYSRARFPRFMARLDPSLHHLQSFANAINSASQFRPLGCLIWGAIQAVMKVAGDYNDVLRETADVISELNESIPLFESYTALFPHCTDIQFPLQDLFDDYLNFCLETISYLQRKPGVSVLRFIWTSSPKHNLERTRANIQTHFTAFKHGATLAHRRNVRQQHLQIEKRLAAAPLASINEDDRGEDGEVSYPVSTVDMFRNYTFMGREEAIKTLHTTLCPSSAQNDDHDNDSDIGGPIQGSPACCVLHGIGGVGKTQTALEYFYRKRDSYEAVFWVHAERDSSLKSTYSAIAEKLGLTKSLGGHEGEHQSRAIKFASEWLKKTTRKWLIVFDNVEDINDLNAYLPTSTRSPGAVIITTQKSNFFAITDVFKKIEISNFSREEGSDLLFKYLERDTKNTTEDEVETAHQISDILGGLPLAIATMGGYMNESDCSLSEFLTDIKKSSNAWEAGSVGPVKQYEKTLETVFHIALSELPPSARGFINILAFLNPDSIPEEVFLTDSGDPSLPFLKSRADLTEAIRVLRRRQLVRRDTSGDEPFLSVHRTVQWNVLLDISKDYKHRWNVFNQAFELLRRGLPVVSPIDNPEPEKWPRFERYVPQVLSLRTHALWPEPVVELPEDFAQVLSDMATYMWHAGLMSQGYDALITAEHILDDHNIQDENPLRGNIHEHLAIIASFYGVSRREECMVRRRKALKARRVAHAEIPNGKVTREDEIRLYNVESDMAFGLMQEEDFDESENYISKCLQQYKKWGTPKEIPFEYLKYNHIISYIRMAQNRPVEAIEHCNEAAKLGEECAGVLHPMTQLCRFSLVNHLYLSGETARALELSMSVLEARSKICGEFNHFTLESHAMCSYVLLQMNKNESAEEHLLTCLDRRKRAYWNSEGVARAQYIYSLVLENLDKHEEAQKQLDEATKTKERYLRTYPQYLKEDLDDLAVFDQMVCLWGGRFSGKLKQPDMEV